MGVGINTSVLILLILLSSCSYHSEPKDNRDFLRITQLSEVEGVYKNKGNPSGYLSQLIWRDLESVINEKTSHEAIQFIEVLASGNSLTVKAITDDCVAYEQNYTDGVDFEISGGKITINRNAYLLSRGSGDVLVGPSYEQITLGLDTGTHGKSRRSEYAAGLVFLMVPVAVSETRETKYERVAEQPIGFKNCNGR